MLLLIILLVLLFGGGGGYYGYSRWGAGGGLGIFGTVLLVVVVVLVDVVDSVIVTAPGPTGGLDSQPMDSAASRGTTVSSRFLILQRQVDADHGSDRGVKTVVLQRHERVEREQKLALQIHLQARYQGELLKSFRQRDQ